jgi:putative glutamine amidotransferase
MTVECQFRRPLPLVAVTLGSDLPDRGSTLRIPMSYVSALVAAGAIPVAIPPGLDGEAVAAVLDRVDGVLLPGGVDPHPRAFDEDVHSEALIDEALDRLELDVIAAAMRRRLPILGVCRGSQILNVALGGSLIQHLPAALLDHRPNGPLHEEVHEISIEPGSRLGRLAGQSSLRVNSFHHQAIARTAESLTVVARAPDGVIEAVESADPDRWLVGVQYHPEELTGPPAHRALFADFVTACTQSRPRR